MTLAMENSSAHRVLRNSVSILSMTVYIKVIRLLSLLIMARYYDQPTFGRYAVIVATTELFRVVGDFGIDVTATKWFLDPLRNRAEVMRTATSLKLSMSCVAASGAVLLALALGYSGELFWSIVVATLSYFFVSVGNLWRSMDQADLSTSRLIWPTIIVNTVYLLGFAVAIELEVSLVGLLAISVVCDGLMFIFLAKDRTLSRPSSPAFSSTWLMFASSVPVGLLAVFGVFNLRVSTLVLSELAGEAAVAQYTSAFRLSEAALIASGAFASSVLPIVVEHFHRGSPREKLSSIISSYLRKVGSIVLGMAIVLNLFSRQILAFFFTGEYVVAHQALSLLAWSIMFASLNLFFTNVLFAQEKQKLALLICALNSTILITLCLFLIPRYGIVGAALASAITEFLNLTGLIRAVIWTTKNSVREVMSPFVLGRFCLWAASLACINVFMREGVPTLAAAGFLAIYLVHVVFFGDIRIIEMRQTVRLLLSLGRSE